MNRLASFSEFALSKEELKKVHGGYWSASCTCANGNSWSGSGQTSKDLDFFNGYYCQGSEHECDMQWT
jgi:natural product precursor